MHEASGVELKLVGDRQGVGRGIRFPGGIKTPRVEGVPWGGKTSGLNPEGNRGPGGDGQGRGVDKKSSATQDIEVAMTAQMIRMNVGRQGKEAQPRPQQDRVASATRGVDEYQEASM